MLLIDAHVHIYKCFDLGMFFDSAFRNFTDAAGRKNLDRFASILLIADWSNASWFGILSGMREVVFEGGDPNHRIFKIHSTHDPDALRITNESRDELFVVAARKIISAENLEVLALCTQADIADGKHLESTIREIADRGAIAVIPWAVGKWMGERGRILARLIESGDRPPFLLCDNGNRPFFWRWPSHFKMAQEKGIPILSGSDPLHFPKEAVRAGTSGFMLPADLPAEHPAGDLRSILSNLNGRIDRYGRLERLWPFAVNQIRMQLFKKKWRRELLK